jgi:hypothetical protein
MIYATQDEIIHTSIFSSQITADPTVMKYGVYFYVGAGGTIHIAGTFGVSLGLSLRNDSRNGINVGCRAGLKFEI